MPLRSTYRTLATSSLLLGLALGSGCGARTTLNVSDDGAVPPRVDAGTPRIDAAMGGMDAGRIGCTTDGDCPNDGLMCNGFAYCNPMTRMCEMAMPERCDDRIDCTDDQCLEGRGCVFVPNPRNCGDEQMCDPMRGCIGGCEPSGPRERECRNGADDDCDGAFDCGDPDCVGTDGCMMCPPIEVRCFDGLDDDCDALTDCADPDCLSMPECRMECIPTERFERSCGDGADNDCNGLFDCADPSCTRTPGCGGCMPVADREIFCADGRDDDCDMIPDCMDSDCIGTPECGGCTPTAMREVACRDGLDDDCDGLRDCDDRDCIGTRECPACTPISMREGRCRDGIDDDCDGSTDCADSDCATRPFCMSACTPTARNELGVDACTNGVDEDCDGRTDCSDPDCSPFGAMGECCDGIDNNGDGNTDEFTCRCFEDDDCAGVGSLDQTCWQETFSICAPRCNLYGGDRFCIDGFMLDRCDRTTGECL
ncbi:MAG: hypothetical protein J0L92_32645 [Deltaproteobacteria bacterium]|nr:hypothetical protein [Deltaproteobacteria bacterium]